MGLGVRRMYARCRQRRGGRVVCGEEKRGGRGVGEGCGGRVSGRRQTLYVERIRRPPRQTERSSSTAVEV